MKSERFEIETGYYEAEDRPLIYDNDSDDDYYFCGDYRDFKSLCELLNQQDCEIKALRKELHLIHMSSMFSTVKSFNGDVSKRYKYDEMNDTAFDTANNYGQYSKILDKKEMVMLLNEYNTLLETAE